MPRSIPYSLNPIYIHLLHGPLLIPPSLPSASPFRPAAIVRCDGKPNYSTVITRTSSPGSHVVADRHRRQAIPDLSAFQ
jgi:hypothetical protein